MFRSLMLVFVAALVYSGTALCAEDAPNWIKLASVDIDVRGPGRKTIDLPDVVFRELRFVVDKPITITGVKTSDGGLFKALNGPFTVEPGAKSPSFYTTKDAGGLKHVEISWSSQGGAASTIRLEIWALQTRLEIAKPKTAPAPAPPPSTRSVGAARPPTGGMGGGAPESRDKSELPPVVASAQAKPNACTDAQVCTLVDVFFGTDRNKVDGPDRVSFGSDRPDVLTTVVYGQVHQNQRRTIQFDALR